MEMNDLRTAAQQALEALEVYATHRVLPGPCPVRDAEYALRAALAQQDAPVAWSGYDLDGMVEAFSRVIEAHHSSKHPFHNPIDMDAKMALRILRGFIPAMKAYAATPQRPAESVPEPYTDDVTRLMRDAGMTFHFGLPHKAVVEQMTRVVDLVYAEASIKAAQQFATPPQRKPLVDPAEYDDAGAAEHYNRGLK